MDPKPTSSSNPQVKWESTEIPVPPQPQKVKSEAEEKTSQVVQQTPLHDPNQTSLLQSKPTTLDNQPQAKKAAGQVNKVLETSSSNIPIAPKFLPKQQRYIDIAPKYKYLVERENSEALVDVAGLFVENTRENQLAHIDNQLKQRTLEKEFQLKVIETKLSPLIHEQVKLRNLLDQKKVLTAQLENLETDPSKNEGQIKDVTSQLDTLNGVIKAQKQQVRVVEEELGDQKRELQEEYQAKQGKIDQQNSTIENLKQRRDSLKSAFQKTLNDLRDNLRNNPIDKRFYDQVNGARDKYNAAVEDLKLRQLELNEAISNYNPNNPESVSRLQNANENYDSQVIVVKEAKFTADSAEWAILGVLNRDKQFEHHIEVINHEQAVAQINDQYVGQIIDQVDHVQHGMPIETTLGHLKEEKIQALDLLIVPSREPRYFATLALTNPPFVLVQMILFAVEKPILPPEFIQWQITEFSQVAPQNMPDSNQEKDTTKSQATSSYTGKPSPTPATTVSPDNPSEIAAITAKEVGLTEKFNAEKPLAYEPESTIENDPAGQTIHTYQRPVERASEEVKINKEGKTSAVSSQNRKVDVGHTASNVLHGESEKILEGGADTLRTGSDVVFQRAGSIKEPGLQAAFGNMKQDELRAAKINFEQKLENKNIERNGILEQMNVLNEKIEVLRDQLKEPDYLPEKEPRDAAQLILESHEETLTQLKLNLQKVDNEIKTLRMEIASIVKQDKAAAMGLPAAAASPINESEPEQEEFRWSEEEIPAAIKNELDKMAAEIQMVKAIFFAEAAKGAPYPAMQPLPGMPSELHPKPEPIISAPGRPTGDQSGGQGSGSQQGQKQDQKRKEESKKGEAKEKESGKA